MRITNNMVTNSILGELQQLETQQSSLQTEVSSGLAVSQPSDDPAAFGQVVQLEDQSNETAQFNKNASQALDLANASYGGLDSLQQIYDRASQLGALGNGTLGNASSSTYADELDQLIQQAVQVANTKLNNTYIYAGTAVSQPPFTTTANGSGQIGSVAYTTAPGGDQQASIALSPTSSVSPSTSGATNQGIAGFINNMISLRDALSAGDSSGISTASAALASSDDLITSAVAENGAVQTRIQADQTQQQAYATELNSLISGDTNADLSQTIVKLNQAQVAYQASLQTAASVMHLSLLNYVNLQ
jgi:flagellar hook-associated protein 3 FlgL